MKLDVLIASIPGAEMRLVGELLPFLPAHIEHCVLCPRCTGKAGVVDMHCAGCNCTGYVERRVCMEGECEACDRLDSLVQPGCDIDDGAPELRMTTPSELSSWFEAATDTTRPLLERQLAASNVVAAADALAAAVKAEEKEQRERDGLPRLALLPAMTVERKS